MNETAEYSSPILINGPLHNENTPSQVPAIMGPPKQIACYSVNPTGVEFNISSLRYFVTPPLGANLDKGCFEFMRRYQNVMHEPQRLDSVLLACLQADAKEYLLQADVVVRRGALVKCVIECR
jgi:RAT1-interacting protein